MFKFFKLKPVISIVTAAVVSVGAFLGMSSNIGTPITAEFEGTILANYYDSVGVETWCTGETQVGYKPDGSYDEAYCHALFTQQINSYSSRLYSCYSDTGKSNVTPEIHAAFTDMYYNTGRKCNSGMIRNINAGKPIEACNYILKYKYAGGYDCSIKGNKKCYGVWKRRLKMHELCMEGANAVSSR